MHTQMSFPTIIRIRQHFARPCVDDIPYQTALQMRRLTGRIAPGSTVGITVGSRGIQNIQTIVKTAVACIRQHGANPVLLAAMGSHGGGTHEGQKEVLNSLGLTESTVGARVITCVTGRDIGVTSTGLHAFMLDSAFGVDAIIPINRVKPHTSFTGAVESGLAKKLVVGLGGPQGAGQFHSIGDAHSLAPLLMDITRIILEKMPVVGGLAILENAYEETAHIIAVPAEELIEKEKFLLRQATALMPALPAAQLDALIVEEMGKNFSGTGIDTNIIGRLRIQGQADPLSPAIRYISVLGLSPQSHGNATGVGLADFVTQSLVDKIDKKNTYLNCLTTTFATRAFIPVHHATEQETLAAMMFCLRTTSVEKIRMAIIPNTLFLTDCYVSEALVPELTDPQRFELYGAAEAMRFDARGRLVQRISAARSS